MCLCLHVLVALGFIERMFIRRKVAHWDCILPVLVLAVACPWHERGSPREETSTDTADPSMVIDDPCLGPTPSSKTSVLRRTSLSWSESSALFAPVDRFLEEWLRFQYCWRWKRISYVVMVFHQNTHPHPPAALAECLSSVQTYSFLHV